LLRISARGIVRMAKCRVHVIDFKKRASIYTDRRPIGPEDGTRYYSRNVIYIKEAIT
jgi:hypothetical protein